MIRLIIEKNPKVIYSCKNVKVIKFFINVDPNTLSFESKDA